MKKISLSLMLLILVVLAALVASSVVIVPSGQVGLYDAQGQAQVLEPGLHFAWPGHKPQLLTVNNQVSHFEIALSQDQESLDVTVMWSVKDVAQFVKGNNSQNTVTTLLQQKVQKLVTPPLIAKTSSSADLAGLVNQALSQDASLALQGVEIVAVWVTNVVPTAAEQKQIFNTMNGLAATTGQSIIENGQAQAEAIRNTAEQDFIQSQAAALTDAAKVLGEGNSDAVKIMAPLYQSNPALFKAYVAAKMKLLIGTQSTS